MKKILCVDDNLDYRLSIRKLLETNENYRVSLCANPMEALGLLFKESFDMVITDLKMDQMNGLQLLQFIKENIPKMRTILLTGYPTAESELAALNIRVDVYLDKSVSQAILLKYIENSFLTDVVEQNSEITDEQLYSKREGIMLDLRTRELWKGNTLQVDITRKEFDILALFLENKEIALSRESILSEVWDEDYILVEQRVVDTHIKTLRKKLSLLSIRTLRGFGYRWHE